MRREIEARHAEIGFIGTPEKDYRDSGLWEFLRYVYTFDEKDEREPVKPIPVFDELDDKGNVIRPGKEYLQVAFHHLLACNRLLVPKSRQIMMSWTLAAFCCWYIRTGKRRRILWQSETESKATDMVSKGRDAPAVGRIDFIEQCLPDWLRDPYIFYGLGNRRGMLQYTPHERDASGVKVGWQGGVIQALAQGKNQVRQYVPSLYINDEMAFQDEAEEAISAILPAVAGAGRLVCVSSVMGGSHFNDMVLDGFGADGELLGGSEWEKIGQMPEGYVLPRGIRHRATSRRFHVLEIHYTSDPAKDPDREGSDWVQQAAAEAGGFDSWKWRTEMEIDYSARGGDPVFPFMQAMPNPIFRHVPPMAEIEAEMRLYAGYDFGTRNESAFIVWGIDKKGRAWALWELYEPCLNYKEHAARIKACPYWEFIEFIVADPSIGHRNQSTASGLRTIQELFSEEGVYMTLGRRGQDVPIAMRFLGHYWADPEKPRAFLCDTCPGLRKEVRGLRWDQHRTEAVKRYKNKPEAIQQKENHAWDATSYVMDRIPDAPKVITRRADYGTFAWAERLLDERDSRARRHREYVNA